MADEASRATPSKLANGPRSNIFRRSVALAGLYFRSSGFQLLELFVNSAPTTIRFPAASRVIGVRPHIPPHSDALLSTRFHRIVPRGSSFMVQMADPVPLPLSPVANTFPAASATTPSTSSKADAGMPL